MYGLVHTALKDMICAKLGAEAWRDICRGHNAPETPLSLETYPDSMTSAMLTEAGIRLNTPAHQLLKEFGRHWVSFIMKSEYGDILKFFGKDFRSSVANLDLIHASVSDALRNARTPKFSIIFSDEHSVEIRYSSERTGLNPFVEGLFIGLLQHFKEEGSVSLLRSSEHQSDFLVSFKN